MEIAIIIVLGVLLAITLGTGRGTKKRLQQLEYICMTNSKRLRFYYSDYWSSMRIEVTPRKDKPWHGSVNDVYKAFASPTGWDARDQITQSQRQPAAEIETALEEEEYQPGAWRKEDNVRNRERNN